MTKRVRYSGIAGVGIVLLVAVTTVFLRGDTETALVLETEGRLPSNPEVSSEEEFAVFSDPEFARAEEEYREAKRTLENVLDKHGDELDPELTEPIEENIGFIEGAVVDLLAALTTDPENESLRQMLLETYRREVRMLKSVLDLTD